MPSSLLSFATVIQDIAKLLKNERFLYQNAQFTQYLLSINLRFNTFLDILNMVALSFLFLQKWQMSISNGNIHFISDMMSDLLHKIGNTTHMSLGNPLKRPLSRV